MTLLVELSDDNQIRLQQLTATTGKSADQLVNEAVEKLSSTPGPSGLNSDWRQSWTQAAGMWKDRTDLPNFEDVRRSMDRNLEREFKE